MLAFTGSGIEEKTARNLVLFHVATHNPPPERAESIMPIVKTQKQGPGQGAPGRHWHPVLKAVGQAVVQAEAEGRWESALLASNAALSLHFVVVVVFVFCFVMKSRSVARAREQWCNLGSPQPLPPG